MSEEFTFKSDSERGYDKVMVSLGCFDTSIDIGLDTEIISKIFY